jgi:predicted O-methyltransferase YrrM
VRQSALNMSSELSVGELAALTGLLGSAGLKGAHLEIGTAAGGTLKELMLCYAPPRPRFVVVDPFTYFPDQRAIVENNLRAAGIDPVDADFRRSLSEPALAAASEANERFDFIFIDANHDARHVIRDLRWARLLSPGGFLCLHDYSAKFPGVVWAVDRFLAKNSNYRRVAVHDSLIVIEKRTDTRIEEVSLRDTLLGDFLSQLHRLRRSARKRLSRLGLLTK